VLKTYKELAGERIKEKREAAGYLTQNDLAVALSKELGFEIDRARVSDWETGKREPKGRKRKALLKVINATEPEIFGLIESQAIIINESKDRQSNEDYITNIAMKAAQMVLEKQKTQEPAKFLNKSEKERQKLIDEIISLLPSLKTNHLGQIRGRILRAKRSMDIKKPKNS